MPVPCESAKNGKCWLDYLQTWCAICSLKISNRGESVYVFFSVKMYIRSRIYAM